MGDEIIHLAEARFIIDGSPKTTASLTMLPVYHYALALPAKFLGLSSLKSLRCISFAYSLIVLAIFYLLAKKLHGKDSASERLMLFAFFPLTLPFFTLLYTDLFALGFILLGVLGFSFGILTLTLIGFAVALAVRQTNLFFMAIPICLSLNKPITLALIKEIVFKYWALILLGLAFVALVLHSGQVVYYATQTEGHPVFKFSADNITFLLSLTSIFFLPNFIGFINQRRNETNRRELLLDIVCLVLALTLALIFKNDHPANQLISSKDPYLHNQLLNFFNNNRIVLGILTFIGARTLCSLKFLAKEQYWIYPLAFITVSCSWLIEPRYYIPLSILMILYADEKSLRPKALLIWWYFLSLQSLILYTWSHKLY